MWSVIMYSPTYRPISSSVQIWGARGGCSRDILMVRIRHGPACIAFHSSHLYITNPGSVSLFAKTWVSLETTTYKSKNTKYFGINWLLIWEQLLHAPPVQIWAQNSTILTPNNLLIVCHSSITNWSQNSLLEFKVNVLVQQPDMGKLPPFLKKSVLWPIRNGGMADY